MKKIILIITVLFLTTGCYDNIELNNLYIVSGIGVDFKNDEYLVTYEIVNTAKSQADNSESFVISGSGKSVADAFNATNLKINRKPYFSHIKLLIFNTSISGDKLKNVIEYIIRDNTMRNEFNIVYTEDEPKKVLDASSEHTPIVSNGIVDMLKNSKYNANNGIDESFEKFFSKTINDLIDPIVNTIILNKKEIKLGKSLVFHNYDIVDYLSIEEATIYNTLINKSHGALFNHEYDGKIVSIETYAPDIDVKIKDHQINITGTVEGFILSNNARLDLRNIKSYDILNKDFSEELNKKIHNFMSSIKLYESDILGLSKLYYQKMRIKEPDIWLNWDVSVDVKVKINKKGFIFEVDYE